MSFPVSQSDTKLISAAIEKLRSFCQENILSNWLYYPDDLTIAEVSVSDFSDWIAVHLNAKENVAWAGGKKVLWLAQKLLIPQDLQGYPIGGLSLRLALTWWANQAEIYVNGKLVCEGDLFDCSPRVLLSPSVTPGEEFVIALRLVSPGHCDGALVRSHLIYESTVQQNPDPGFVADELAVVQRYLQNFAPDRLDRLAAMVEKVINCQNAKSTKQELESQLLTLRQNLVEVFPSDRQSKIFLLGHAHLDMAWLWRVNETWQAAQNTFESVLKLQQDFPELIFCHSTPALYAWVEEHRPELFKAIQEKVADGSWEVVGGFWIEPDLNLIAGESIARQLLYGQRYWLQKFGKLATVEWVPDTFGFCATLPQFLKQAGIEYFVTQKLRWNDTNKFPYGALWWRSPDGSEIFSFMSAPIGEGIDPVKMVDYAIEWQTQTNSRDSLWLPGVGDHGGGPTRDMLEIGRRWQKSSVFPQLEFTTAEKYLQHLESTVSSSSPLPTWNDELYLEFHRGCYTTHADQKRWNRRCESLLYQAEVFAAIAKITTGATYPHTELEAAWKKLLFNQFHDILPGSSITEVYEDAVIEWQEVEKAGTEILQQSLQAIASQINLSEPPQPGSFPVLIFNSLNWQRSEVVSVSLPPQATPNDTWQIYDTSGNEVASQLSDTETLLFLASDIPSVGYRLFWLYPSQSQKNTDLANYEDTKLGLQKQEQISPQTLSLENEFLRVIIDEQTGNLSSVFDKVNHREVLNQACGNQLQAFQDSGQYWDAWNIDPNYAEHPLPPANLKSIQWLENGLIQKRLRVVQQLGNSEFRCDYILQAASPILKIATKVDWQERHVMVKAAFPVNVEADFATYEIPCGAIDRPTKPQTTVEQAKWEVPAIRWADLSENQGESIYGVSLLNDCKYGYDAQPHQLRLTLLRSSTWPDPQADKGFHEFTYALYPHAGDWKSAQTVRRGYELNTPLQVMVYSDKFSPKSSEHPKGERSFLDLSAENLILMTFKQAEDNQEDWILRCYECHGQIAELSLQSDLELNIEKSVDLLEHPLSTSNSVKITHKITLRPWEIASFQMKVSNSANT